MIKVFIMFRFFYTKEEWITFAQKLYSNKQFVKYMKGKKYLSHYNLSVEDYINDVYNKCKNDSEEIEEVIIGSMLGIKTQSTKTLKLLNEFLKENHYENNYTIWRESHGSTDRMHMTLDELLDKYSK